jgi:hypothetical protein
MTYARAVTLRAISGISLPSTGLHVVARACARVRARAKF